MIDISEKNIDAASCCLHVLEAGNPDARAVILLHGMKFQAATWQEPGTLEKPAGAGYHPLALEFALDQPDIWHAAVFEFLESL